MAPVRRSSAAAGDACAEPIVTRTGQLLGRCGSALDRLQVRDIRTWLNQLRTTCQCCAQGKDATRPADRRRCCAIGARCHQVLSERTIKDVRDVLRAALANAVAEELLPATSLRSYDSLHPGNRRDNGGQSRKPGLSWDPPVAIKIRCMRPTC